MKINTTTTEREIDWLLDEKYSGKTSSAFFDDINRLKNGEPLAFIIGNIPFLGATIDLSSKPLIPRTETEFWVEKAIKQIQQTKKGTVHCLDLFAGSGCIGIAVLLNIHNSIVDFGEKEKHHIFQISKNLVLNKINSTRTSVFVSDVFESIPARSYDYIFANPPYVDIQNKQLVDRSVFNWEPQEAVFSKDGGFFFIKQILKSAYQYLSKNGTIFLEFSPVQKNKIKELATAYEYTVDFKKDQYRKYRLAVFTKNDS